MKYTNSFRTNQSRIGNFNNFEKKNQIERIKGEKLLKQETKATLDLVVIRTE